MGCSVESSTRRRSVFGAEMSRAGGPKPGWFSALNASILNSYLVVIELVLKLYF